MSLQTIGAIAIVVGIALELFLIGSEYSLGTAIAAIGIFVFVYAYFDKREKRDRH